MKKRCFFLILLFPVLCFGQHGDSHDTPIKLLEYQMKEVNKSVQALIKINTDVGERLTTLETSIVYVKNQVQDIKESKDDALPSLKEVIVLCILGAGAGSGGLYFGKRKKK